MKEFIEIGVLVEKAWRDKNYQEDEFPAIAAEALKSFDLPRKVPAWDVIEWALGETQLPEQKDLRGNFGDPPITIYNSPRFHIDVYFWLEGTTAIHQHGFCGAFQVLYGSSIHSWYEFEASEKINTFMEIGELDLKLCELLEVGDVQEIQPGRQYIHGLFHLDQPSATIVIRTHKSPLQLPQFAYHKPFLAIDPFFEEANAVKKNQCISALFRSDHPETDKFVSKLLSESDFHTSYSILTTARAFLRQNQLSQMFDLSVPKNRFDGYLDAVKKRHGKLTDILPAVFAQQDKVNEIITRRNYVSDPEHRFLFALLMNVDGRDEILKLIKKRFPEADPIEKVLDWALDLANTRVLGAKIPNALGIEDFGDLDLFILECRLKGLSDDEMRKAFRAEYPTEKIDELTESLTIKTERIDRSVIFDSLLH